MTDIPIIFSAPMVLALLADRKTMTRRLALRHARKNECRPHEDPKTMWAPSPWQRVKPGDRLWVKEGWRWNVDYHTPIYRTDYPEGEGPPVSDFFYRWRSPIHLARKDSRLTLIVTATKIERLQDIPTRDVRAEGVEVRQFALFGADSEGRQKISAQHFRPLWEELHGDESWHANPEVVALTFTVHKKNIDAMRVAA